MGKKSTFLIDTCLVTGKEKYHSCALRYYLIQTKPRMILHRNQHLITLYTNLSREPYVVLQVASQKEVSWAFNIIIQRSFNSGYSEKMTQRMMIIGSHFNNFHHAIL